MYDLSELEPTTKEIAIGILAAVAVLVVVFCAGYLFGIRNAGKTDAGGVPNNGTGIDDIRNELGTAISNQHAITDGLTSAVAGSNSIEERSNRIEKAAGAAAQSVTDAGKLIDDCQQIIGRIRNRGQKGTAAH